MTEALQLYNLFDEKGSYSVNVINSETDYKFDHDTTARLKYWIQSKKGNVGYSCIGFLYYLTYGVDVSPATTWDIQFTNRPNNLVYIYSSKNIKNFHCALRIQELDLYLSQFGNGGSQILTSLENMQRFFETDSIKYITSLKPNNNQYAAGGKIITFD